MTNGMTESTISAESLICPWPLNSYPDAVRTYQFDFVTPAGEQDTLLNNLKPYDLVYESAAGKVRKLAVQTTNAIAKAAVIGIVARIALQNDNVLYDEYDFTEDGGILTVIKGTHFFGDKAFIYNTVTAGPDTRDAFVYATHAGASAVLENLVKPDGYQDSRPIYRFV